ncbi:hypothetical protein [Brevundimonas sp.]|uniref:hypothetical protein n=1 Tax=Brevundimonas sp. TaxID=1871086 RepID=UPI002FC6E284
MKPVTFLAAVLALAACDTQVETRKEAVPAAEQAATAAPAETPVSARPSGPARVIAPSNNAGLQGAASVTAVQPLHDHGYSAKLLNLTGGDPAANGNQLYLAFYVSPAEGWTMFMLGDFASWELVEEGARGLIFDTTSDVVGPEGNIVRGPNQRYIVTYAPGGPEATAPDSVSITPAA